MTTDKQAVIDTMIALYRKRGKVLRPSEVVEAARKLPETHPLRQHFEWDDTRAAQKWRLLQARNLIQTVMQVTEDGVQVMQSRIFIRDGSAGAHQEGYVMVADVAQDPEQARASLAYSIRQIQGQLEQTERTAKVLGLLPMVRKIRQAVDRFLERLAA